MPINFSQNKDLAKKVSEKSRTQVTHVTYSPFTELGKKLGLQMFKAAKYIDDNRNALIYIPNIGSQELDGEVVVNFERVNSITAYQLGKERSNNSTLLEFKNPINLHDGDEEFKKALEEAGVSVDNPKLIELLDKARQIGYRKADLISYSRFGVPASELDDDDERSGVFTKAFAVSPIDETTTFYIPIVEFESYIDEDGLEVPKLTKDEDGNVTIDYEISFYAIGEDRFKTLNNKELKLALGLKPKDSISGNIVKFAYELPARDYKKLANQSDKTALRRTSGRKMSYSAYTKNASNEKKVAYLEKAMFEKWDKEVAEKYLEHSVSDLIKSAQLYTDEEINAFIDKHYANIDAQLEQLENLLSRYVGNEDSAPAPKQALSDTNIDDVLGIE